MSGTSYENVCPACGGSIQMYSDWKPIDTVSGQCLECGFGYYTKGYQMTLSDVNDQRIEMDLEPLTELSKQNEEFIKDWVEE